jgi:hypothetical protein
MGVSISPVPQFLNVIISMASALVNVEVCFTDNDGMIAGFADISNVTRTVAISNDRVIPYPMLINVLSAYQ